MAPRRELSSPPRHSPAAAAFKHTFEKVEDHWQRKRRKGPRSVAAERSARDTYGGLDVFGRTKAELLALARRFDVRGRSRMSKAELARALSRVR